MTTRVKKAASSSRRRQRSRLGAARRTVGDPRRGTAIPQELQAPLPGTLQEAHRQALAQYFVFEERQALRVYEAHRPLSEEPTPEPG